MVRRGTTVVCLALAGWTSAAIAAEPATWESGKGFRYAPLKIPATGRVGFAQLPAIETGIYFTNSLPLREATMNYNLLNRSGVAAGDFDRDPWCGLYFFAISGTNRLCRNQGNW